MNQTVPSPRMRDLARELFAYEAAAHNSSESNMPAVFRVFEALRRPLSTLAGAAGFRALLARALTLAKAQVPALGAVEVKPDGSLDGLSDLPDNEYPEACLVLIAQLLGLLAGFIGETLMRRILLDVWPDLSVVDTEPSGESQHDATR